jgi:hypothetical protein
VICTVVRVDTGQPFIARAEIVVNEDTSVSFKLVDGADAGKFAGQEPNQVGQPSTYGVRYPNTVECGAYQRASIAGNSVTFQTRPQDIPCGYLIFIGKAY